jgi:transcriptional regulator with XRE-family HTH domain
MLYKNNKGHLTQKELANAYGISQQYVSEVVNDKKLKAVMEIWKE